MSDPRLTDLLADRSERGEPRGADQVWAGASEPDYVAEASPPVRPGLWLAAAATCVFFVFAGLAVVRQGDTTASVADRFDDGEEWAANCFLEVDRNSDRSLAEWAEALEADPGFEQVDTVDLPEGGAYLGVMPHVIESPYGIAFEAHPMSVAETLADEPGVTELTCVEIPPWRRIPDPIPAGTTVVAIIKDPEASMYWMASALERLPWMAWENVSPDEALEHLGSLVDQPDLFGSIDLDDLRGHQTLILVDDDDVDWIVEEFSARDDVRLVALPEDQ